MDVVDLPFIQQGEQLIRNISNSEVTTFLSCKRQYEYNFMMVLEPKKVGDPLARGSAFHLGMEKYWLLRIEGMDHEPAMQQAEVDAFSSLPDGYSLDMLMAAQKLWRDYMIYHNGFPTWKPLGTEQQFILKITPTINMAIKYDFYFQDLTTGKCYILDYKLSYDFWSFEDHDLNGQMPKYITVLQANGHRVDGGYLEEIRTRPLGKEKASDPKNLWRRTPYKPSFEKKKAMLAQHITASVEIEKHRALPEEERKSAAIPVLNKHGACKFCNYKDLCMAENEGKRDLSVDIRVGYRTNAYVKQYNDNPGAVDNVDF